MRRKIINYGLLFGQAVTLCRSVLITNIGLHTITTMAGTPQLQCLTTCKSGCCVFTFFIHHLLQQRKYLFLSSITIIIPEIQGLCLKFEYDQLQMCTIIDRVCLCACSAVYSIYLFCLSCICFVQFFCTKRVRACACVCVCVNYKPRCLLLFLFSIMRIQTWSPSSPTIVLGRHE